ncbi:SGNH/GDSL hydrolase family protein [Pseudoclavibacter sp. VKM Ac-2867]|uniref:SGNH/GDSL hydrolase family protein n=1 Tax=Pseudoclavibacter sp. VKM Ac-2867 TaxID=2783829 RepID=UPI00188AD373|nr:SGNH/GDSL hydrolase family protein [Pseudoclavibacter sp. VKM Ac-2867]MBF4458218.1 SGNH/GDSL hydrolase family protein [Pseudoclavibacter sp. VKM Ac-2867]
MTSRSRLRAAAVGVAAACIALLAPSGALAAPLGDAMVNGGTQAREYIALGDSYSSGFGLVPFSEEPAAGCFQALANYPHRVADSLGLALDDRTCSGAVTADIRDTEQVTASGANAPVQSASLSATTEFVTLSIGGNDLEFSDIAASCVAASSLGPLVADQTVPNCRSQYVVDGGGVEVDALKDRIDSLIAPALASTFALIAEKAPNADIVVVGYPAITPDPTNTPVGGCFSPAFTSAGYPENSFPFTDVDTAYLHETEVHLDEAIKTAAEASGATFISTLKATSAHSACSTTAPYMNGITAEPGEGASTTPGAALKLGALHPNEAGVAYLAETVGAKLQALLEPGTPETTTPTPTATATATATDQPTDTAATTATPAAPLVIAGVLVLGGAGIATTIILRRRSAAARSPLEHDTEV